MFDELRTRALVLKTACSRSSLTGLAGFPPATGTFSGRGDMESSPNNGTSQGDNNLDTPRVDYCVNLPLTGTWFVWLRYVGPTGF